jgi:hypothetical protein
MHRSNSDLALRPAAWVGVITQEKRDAATVNVRNEATIFIATGSRSRSVNRGFDLLPLR